MAKLSLSSLYARAILPPFGVVRTPLTLLYELRNQTDKVQEYALTMEPSEAFMMSGNKQAHFKILPYKKRTLTYVLYPLLAGSKVTLPKLKLASLRYASQQDVNETLERLLPETITVLPRARNEDEVDNKQSSGSDFYVKNNTCFYWKCTNDQRN